MDRVVPSLTVLVSTLQPTTDQSFKLRVSCPALHFDRYISLNVSEFRICATHAARQDLLKDPDFKSVLSDIDVPGSKLDVLCPVELFCEGQLVAYISWADPMEQVFTLEGPTGELFGILKLRTIVSFSNEDQSIDSIEALPLVVSLDEGSTRDGRSEQVQSMEVEVRRKRPALLTSSYMTEPLSSNPGMIKSLSDLSEGLERSESALWRAKQLNKLLNKERVWLEKRKSKTFLLTDDRIDGRMESRSHHHVGDPTKNEPDHTFQPRVNQLLDIPIPMDDFESDILIAALKAEALKGAAVNAGSSGSVTHPFESGKDSRGNHVEQHSIRSLVKSVLSPENKQRRSSITATILNETSPAAPTHILVTDSARGGRKSRWNIQLSSDNRQPIPPPLLGNWADPKLPSLRHRLEKTLSRLINLIREEKDKLVRLARDVLNISQRHGNTKLPSSTHDSTLSASSHSKHSLLRTGSIPPPLQPQSDSQVADSFSSALQSITILSKQCQLMEEQILNAGKVVAETQERLNSNIKELRVGGLSCENAIRQCASLAGINCLTNNHLKGQTGMVIDGGLRRLGQISPDAHPGHHHRLELYASNYTQFMSSLVSTMVSSILWQEDLISKLEPKAFRLNSEATRLQLTTEESFEIQTLPGENQLLRATIQSAADSMGWLIVGENSKSTNVDLYSMKGQVVSLVSLDIRPGCLNEFDLLKLQQLLMREAALKRQLMEFKRADRLSGQVERSETCTPFCPTEW